MKKALFKLTTGVLIFFILLISVREKVSLSTEDCRTTGCPKDKVCTVRVKCRKWETKEGYYCCKVDECGYCIKYCTGKHKECVEFGERYYVCLKPCRNCPKPRVGVCSCVSFTWKEHPFRIRPSETSTISFLLEAKATGQKRVTAASVTFRKPDGQTQTLKSKNINEKPGYAERYYLIETEPLTVDIAGRYKMVGRPILNCE